MANSFIDTIAWDIKEMPNNPKRYVIYDVHTDVILDDAQGHGFKNYDSAYNYGSNKYKSNGMCRMNKSNPLF